MKPIIKYTLIGLLVVLVAGISVASVAYAQGDDPHGRDSLAELLGLTTDELRDQIQHGKTIQELADEAGVDLEAYREKTQLIRQENMQNRIEEALANGDISQDQADWLMEGFEKGYLDDPFFEMGGRVAGDFGGRPDFDGERPSGMRGGKPSADQ